MGILEEVLQKLDSIAEGQAALRAEIREVVQGPEWYTLKAACERKGATYNTIKSRPDLQPNGGKAEGQIGGRRVWSRATVDQWARMVDGAPARRKGAA